MTDIADRLDELAKCGGVLHPTAREACSEGAAEIRRLRQHESVHQSDHEQIAKLMVENERLRFVLGEKRHGPSAAASAMSEMQKGQVIDLALNAMDESHALRNYIEFLGKAYNRASLLAHVHGFQETEADIEEGYRLRKLAGIKQADRPRTVRAGEQGAPQMPQSQTAPEKHE